MKIHHERQIHSIDSLNTLADRGEMVIMPGTVGNQDLATLAVMKSARVIPVLADTVQVREVRQGPLSVRIGGSIHSLASKRFAAERIAGSVPIDPARYDQLINLHPNLAAAHIYPKNGMVGALHVRSLEAVDTAAKRVVTITEELAEAGEAGAALMLELAGRGLVRRVVESSGKVRMHMPGFGIKDFRHTGVYGQEDQSPSDQGVLLPLAGALPLMVMRAQAAEKDTMYQLVSGQSADLLSHPDILHSSAEMLGKVSSTLGNGAIDGSDIRLVLVSYDGINSLVAPGLPDTYTQYDRLAALDTLAIVPVEAYDRPLAA